MQKDIEVYTRRRYTGLYKPEMVLESVQEGDTELILLIYQAGN